MFFPCWGIDDLPEAKLKVELLAFTPQPDITAATAAHMCYAGVTIEDLRKKVSPEYAKKLVKTLASEGHLSPLEHASFTFGIEGISRACSHQLVRHRIASYCLTGDTVIKGARQKSKNYKKFTIKSLYERALTPHGRSRLKLIMLNSFDEGKKQFDRGKIGNIVYTGKHEVWKVKLTDGKSVKATLNHRFLTKNGWCNLREIIQNKPELGVNGITCQSQNFALLRDKDWLRDFYNCKNFMQKEIAELLGCSEHTVRAWVRQHGLQKEAGGLHGHEPHRGYHWKLNRERTLEGRMKVSERMKGQGNPMWKGGITPEAILLRKEISPELRKAIYTRDGYTCKLCQKTGGELTLHHKIPLYADKTKNTAPENLVTLCKSCHWKVNANESDYCAIFKTELVPYYSKSKGCYRTIKWAQIESIELQGIEDTYDITMQGPHHNFVANGFVVHNSQQSQRYVKETGFNFIVPPKIKSDKEAYKKFLGIVEQCRKSYEELLKAAPAEDARFVLPNACETRIIVTMNTRALYNFFERRCCTRAQWEIRAMAEEMLRLCRAAAPIMFEETGPVCGRLGYCPEKQSCGRKPLRKDAIKE